MISMRFFFFFFFSSRRRHTRSYGDWSSDVCSSDLCETVCKPCYETCYKECQYTVCKKVPQCCEKIVCCTVCKPVCETQCHSCTCYRSEERRVGKECRSRWELERERTEKACGR